MRDEPRVVAGDDHIFVPGWDEDEMVALAKLVERSGATEFEFGAMNLEAKTIAEAQWYASARFQGARIMTGLHTFPSGAIGEMTARMLTGAMCKCGAPVTVSDRQPGCRWRRMGPQWKTGCTADPIRVQGKRGDVAAMHAAFEERYPNRAARRRAERKQRKGESK